MAPSAPDRDHQDPAVSGAAIIRPTSLPSNTVNLANPMNPVSPPDNDPTTALLTPDQDHEDHATSGAAIFRPISPPRLLLFNGHPLVKVSEHFSQSQIYQVNHRKGTINM